MTEFKWGNISPGGEAFQALVSALILWEDKDAAAFRKPGKDCGIDAISGNRKRVIQAKYRFPGQPTEIISAAKKEFKAIKKHQSEKRCQDLWRGIEQWELVTNVDFNSSWELKWEKEILPLFETIGLKAELTGKASLETRLLKFPDLCSAFFGGENRIFLSLPEIRKKATNIIFDKEALNTDYIGHEEQMTEFRNFIESDKRILMINGMGGVGKTRFLLEAAENQVSPEWQVIWANVETMSGRSDWLKGIPLGRNTLLCLDDPPKSLVAIILEQVSIVTGAMAEWKIAIADRDMDNEIEQLLVLLPDEVRGEISLDPLQEDESKQLAITLLKQYGIKQDQDEWLNEAAEYLSKLSGGIPLWITVPIKMLKECGELTKLPEKTEQIANKYIREATDSIKVASTDQITAILQWLALISELNIENESMLEFIVVNTTLTSKSHLKRILYSLTDGILFRKGIHNRIFFIKPDPLADKLLEEWLLSGLGSNEDIEKDEQVDVLCSLIEEAVNTKRLDIAKQIATGLMRCRALIKYEYNKEIELLETIYYLLEEQLDAQTVSSMLNWLDILDHISPSNPSRVIDICAAIWSHHFESEDTKSLFLGERVLTKSDILDEIPWLLYVTSQYVSSYDASLKAFNLLVELVKKNVSRDKPDRERRLDKGKTATAILSRILTEDQNFPEYFTEIAMEFIICFLDSISEKSEEESTECISLINTLISPFLAEEHMSPRFERNKFVITRTFRHPGSQAWDRRKQIKEKLKELLEGNIQSTQIRLKLWKSLDDTHGSLVRSRRHLSNDTDKLEILLADQKEDLEWLYEQLKEKKELSVAEIRASRDIWDWHVRYEENKELKRIAEECEFEAQKNEPFSRFEKFTDMYEMDDIREYSQNFAEWMLELSSVDAMIDLLNEASIYFKDLYGWGFSHVAYELGNRAVDDSRIQLLAKRCIAKALNSFQYQFAIYMCTSWLSIIRKKFGSAEAVKLCEEILSWCCNESSKADVLINLYRQGSLTDAEIDEIKMLWEFETLFSSIGKTADYLAMITNTANVNFLNYRDIANSMLDELDTDDKETATYGILHSIHMMKLSHNRNGDFQLSKEIVDWILNRVVTLPQMSFWNDNTILEVMEIIKDDQPNIQWLYRTLKKRVQIASSDDAFKIVPIHSRISEIVKPLPEIGEIISDEEEAVKGILGFIENKDFLGYELPKYLLDIDPYGRAVPNIIFQQLKEMNKSEYDIIWKRVRIASVYEDNSPAWRVIAESACDIAITYDDKMKYKIWSSLLPYGYSSWSSPVDEVAQKFYDAISEAEKKLNEECYSSMIPFREWVLEGAKAELKREEDRLEEEY